MYSFGDNRVTVVNSETGQIENITGLENCKSWPQKLPHDYLPLHLWIGFEFSHDGDFVAFATSAEISVWNWATKEIVWKLPNLEVLGLLGFNFALANGKLAHKAAHDGSIKIYDIKSGELVKVLPGHRVFKSEKYFVISHNKQRYYDTEIGKLVMTNHQFLELVVDPKYNIMAAVDNNKDVTFMEYNASNGNDPKVIEKRRIPSCKQVPSLFLHKSRCNLRKQKF